MAISNTVEYVESMSDFVAPETIEEIQQKMRELSSSVSNINRDLDSDEVRGLIDTFAKDCPKLYKHSIVEHNTYIPPATHGMEIISGRNFAIHLRRDVQNKKWVFGFTIHRIQ